jgi:hypothetical protein
MDSGHLSMVNPSWPAVSDLEFGTTRIAAAPWLGPAFQARLPGINHALRKVVTGTLKALGKG